jgi:cyclopropane fatty-acyl-phospholipid synthase-like methyltransferase
MATVESQYERCLDIDRQRGRTALGLMTNQVWQDDPRRLLFVLSRYKFVSKMLSGRNSVFEIGCADAFGTRIVRQTVKAVLATDIDPIFIADCNQRAIPGEWDVRYRVHDILTGPIDGEFDAGFSLDVFEHIGADSEGRFLENTCRSLPRNGVFVIGTPSLESQQYASPGSIAGHVNCKSSEDLQSLCRQYFANVFMFSMSDEVVHTGFAKMAHYLFALCVGRIS